MNFVVLVTLQLVVPLRHLISGFNVSFVIILLQDLYSFFCFSNLYAALSQSRRPPWGNIHLSYVIWSANLPLMFHVR